MLVNGNPFPASASTGRRRDPGQPEHARPCASTGTRARRAAP